MYDPYKRNGRARIPCAAVTADPRGTALRSHFLYFLYFPLYFLDCSTYSIPPVWR